MTKAELFKPKEFEKSALRFSLDGKLLMRFRSENAVFKFRLLRQGDGALASRDFDHNNVYCFIRLYCSVLRRTHWSESNRIDDCR